MICDEGFSKEKTHTEVSNYINTKKRTKKFNFDLNQGVGTDGQGNVELLYCPSDLLQHPVYESCLFLYYLRLRLG